MVRRVLVVPDFWATSFVYAERTPEWYFVHDASLPAPIQINAATRAQYVIAQPIDLKFIRCVQIAIVSLPTK